MSQDINRQNKGINLDVAPEDQPKGTGRYRKNMVNNQKEGLLLLSNELSNKSCGSIPQGSTLVGECYLIDNEHVVFIINTSGISEIGLLKADCSYETLVEDECLGFSTSNPIDAEYRLRLGCQRTVYFVQDNNPLRWFNLDKPSTFYTKEYYDWDCITGTKPPFKGKKWDCAKFKMIRDYETPCFKNVKIGTGGSILSGSYNAGILYADESLNKTNPIYSSQTINIYNDPDTKSYTGIMGSSNIQSDPLSGQYPTNKTIEFELDSLDTRFPYYHIIIFEASSGTGEVSNIYMSPRVPISQTTFIFTGFTDGWTTLSQDDISFDKVDIASANHIDQIENKLIVASIKERDVNYCNFQKYASKVCATYEIKEILSGDVDNHGDPKCPVTPFDTMGVLRDEVYAPHIVYEWIDGGVTPGFPIIPRAKDKFTCTTKKISKKVYKQCLVINYSFKLKQSSCKGIKYSIKYTVNGVIKNLSGELTVNNEQLVVFCGKSTDIIVITDFKSQALSPKCEYIQIKPLIITQEVIEYTDPVNGCLEYEGYDSEKILTWSPDMEFIIPKSEETEYNKRPLSEKIEKWQVYNTARKNTATTGDFGYYECVDVPYPMRKTCDGSDYWGYDACDNKVENNIRWFRTPGTDIEPLVRKEMNLKKVSKIGATVYFTNPPNNGFLLNIKIEYKELGVYKVFTTKVKISYSQLQSFDLIDYNGPKVDITDITVTIIGYPKTFASGYVHEFIKNETVTYLRILGFKFDNVQYPHPDIVGHHFVLAKRESQNKTVLDKGFTGKLKENKKYLSFGYFTNGNNSVQSNWFFMPNFFFKNQIDKPDYVKIDSKWHFDHKTVADYNYDQPGGALKEIDITIGNRQQYYGDEDTLPQHNYSLSKYTSLNAIAFDNSYKPPLQTFNLSQTNKILIGDTTDVIPYYENDIAYVSYKVNRNVFCNLDSLKLYRMHNCILHNDAPNIIFGGDTYIVPFQPINVLFREFFNGFFDDFLKILVIATAVGIVVATLGSGTPGAVAIVGAINGAISLGITSSAIATAAIVAGAIGVTAQAITGIVNAYKDSLLSTLANDAEIDNALYKFGSFISYAGERLEGLWVESDMNLALQLNENHECGKVFNTSNYINFEEYLVQKILYFDANENAWLGKQIICPESYRYNVDYSRMNTQTIYFPLDPTYDCCSKCRNEFPHRVYASEQSFQEELSDNYRRFLPNNYIDIQGNTGEISDLFTKANTLYVVTPECTYAILPNIQERTTNQIVSFLGTGDFFAIPPRKLSDDDTGSVGSSDKWATLKTKFGVFIVDQHENKIYIFNSTITDIAKTGLFNYFKTNLKPHFQTSFKNLFGYEYPFANNPFHDFGTGIHATFDYENLRYILTKIDYKFTPGAEKQVTLLSKGPKEGQLFFDDRIGINGLPLNQWTILKNGQYEVIPFSNKDYFENVSFTMSYSLLDNSWASWHSYLPYRYIYDQSKVLSFIKEDNNIWKHNIEGSVGEFYGKQENSVFEYVVNNNPLLTQMTDSLTVQLKAQVYDPVTKQYREVNDTFFDSIIAYNSRQSTGKQEVILKNDNENKENYLTASNVHTPGKIIIDRTETDWNINDLRDYRIDYDKPIFSSDWKDIEVEFPIDKVLNAGTINFNKDWLQLEVLRDKYLIVRFETKNEKNTLFLIKYQINFNSQSPH